MTITHIRTPFRLIPTALVGEFRQDPIHLKEIRITDSWTQRYPSFPADHVQLGSAGAARRAMHELRLLLSGTRCFGPYVRLCPPGYPAASRKWTIAIETYTSRGCEGREAYTFMGRMDALIAFQEIAQSLSCLDVCVIDAKGNGIVVH